MHDYCVRHIWHLQASVNAEERWGAFQASPFIEHIPRFSWPDSTWTAERVSAVLRKMTSPSSPGVRGSLFFFGKDTAPFLARVTDLLDLIETSEEWPKELIQAYVTMITKASGGTRPQDQRPSTVLDVVYGI